MLALNSGKILQLGSMVSELPSPLPGVTKRKDKMVSGAKNKVKVKMANVMPDTLVAEQMKKAVGAGE